MQSVLGLAALEARAGNHAQAQRIYEAGLVMQPSNVQLLHAYALFRLQKGDKQVAPLCPLTHVAGGSAVPTDTHRRTHRLCSCSALLDVLAGRQRFPVLPEKLSAGCCAAVCCAPRFSRHDGTH
jgi:hypothetical protein